MRPDFKIRQDGACERHLKKVVVHVKTSFWCFVYILKSDLLIYPCSCLRCEQFTAPDIQPFKVVFISVVSLHFIVGSCWIALFTSLLLDVVPWTRAVAART